MVSKKIEDGALPSGWKLEIKIVSNNRKIKCYVHSKTQKKFYSRASMLRYIKDRSIANKRSSTTKEQTKKSPEKKQVDVTDGVEADDSNDWLPSGWIMETRIRQTGTRKGTPYKCYIDPESGSKFFSKPEVYRYLESTQRSGGSSHQKEKGNSKPSTSNKSADPPSLPKSGLESNVSQLSKTNVQKSHALGNLKKSADPPSPPKSGLESNVSQLSKTKVQKSHSSGNLKVVVQKVIDEELPSGWIKEIRNKMNGERVARTDPFYIDTATGLVFRSKPDALRYVQTGEISRHAYRRKNGRISEEELALVKTSPPSAGETEKEAKATTSKKLFADEATPKQRTSAPAEASGVKETGSRRTTRSSSRGIVAPPVHEASLDQSTSLQPAVIPTADEASPKQHISTLPETSGTKETGSRRSTRSSTKVGVAPVPEASLEQSTPVIATKTQLSAEEVDPQQCTSALPEASDMKETGSRRKTRASSKVGPAPVLEASLEQSNSTPLQPAIVTTDKPPFADMKETGSRRKTRLSSRAGVAPVSEASLEQSTPLQREVVATINDLFGETVYPEQPPLSAVPETSGIIETGSRRSTRSSLKVGVEQSKPSTISSDDMLIEEEPETVAMKGSSNQKTRAGKRKMKDRKTPTLPARSSKRLAKEEDSTDVVFEAIPVQRLAKEEDSTSVVFEPIPVQDALRAVSRKSTKTQGSPISVSIPFGSSPEKPQIVNVAAQNGLASPDEKLRPVNSDAQTVLATPENSSKAVNIVIDIVSQINAQVMEFDLEEYPPGFAPNPSTETSSIEKIDKPSVDPTDSLPRGQTEKSPRNDTQPTERQQSETLPESKISASFGVDPILEEQKEEQKDAALRTEPGKTTGDYLINLEQPPPAPESQFPLSSPLWSDPCLEFAYKTLTGAIPLDDNLAIEDYIQHQLRTSEQSNQNVSDRGVPSFFQSHEPKPVSSFPEAIIPNSNGFSSQTPRR